METFYSRVNKLIDLKSGSSRSKFAASIGMHQVSFNTYMNGREPKIGFALAILSTFPDISAEWLMRGEGSMYKDAHAGGVSIVNDNRRNVARGNGNVVASDNATVNTVQKQDNSSEIIAICKELLKDDGVDKNEVVKLLNKLV